MREHNCREGIELPIRARGTTPELRDLDKVFPHSNSRCHKSWQCLRPAISWDLGRLEKHTLGLVFSFSGGLPPGSNVNFLLSWFTSIHSSPDSFFLHPVGSRDPSTSFFTVSYYNLWHVFSFLRTSIKLTRLFSSYPFVTIDSSASLCYVCITLHAVLDSGRISSHDLHPFATSYICILTGTSSWLDDIVPASGEKTAQYFILGGYDDAYAFKTRYDSEAGLNPLIQTSHI